MTQKNQIAAAPRPVLYLCLIMIIVELSQWILPDAAARNLMSYLVFSNSQMSNAMTFFPKFFPEAMLRSVTSAFAHGGMFHLITNCMILIVLGSPVCRLMGTYRFIVFFCLCSMGGAILFWLIVGAGPFLVGASGAIFGMAAAVGWMRVWPEEPNQKFKKLFEWTVGWMILNALIALLVYLTVQRYDLPFIEVAWQAHLGGYLMGLFIAPKLLVGLPRLSD